MAGMKEAVLRLSVTEDDDNESPTVSVPPATLSGRRRAVDASDLRQCALVQTMIKSSKTSPAFTAHRYVHLYNYYNYNYYYYYYYYYCY